MYVNAIRIGRYCCIHVSWRKYFKPLYNSKVISRGYSTLFFLLTFGFKYKNCIFIFSFFLVVCFAWCKSVKLKQFSFIHINSFPQSLLYSLRSNFFPISSLPILLNFFFLRSSFKRAKESHFYNWLKLHYFITKLGRNSFLPFTEYRNLWRYLMQNSSCSAPDSDSVFVE